MDTHLPTLTSLLPAGLPAIPALLAVRADLATLAMLLLIVGLGWVIGRYSRSYLAGEPTLPGYQRGLWATLAAATLLVVTDHLLVLMLAWSATSLSLHQLLLTFPDRPGARRAAEQKFVVSRLAEAALLVALGLVQLELGTLSMTAVGAAVAQMQALPPTLTAAALLLVAAVCAKTAQLPLHGWLTQVMEAPTPVSALLHAGVVNIGGLVLIRMAPLLSAAPAAQLVLVGVGATTAVLAGLTMMTRTDVKATLAWSTMAQMGLMLVQCGLGAYDLALLHLVGHSLYKAAAFLGAGGAVERWQRHHAAPGRNGGAAAELGGGLLALLLAATAAAAANWLQAAPVTVGMAALWSLAMQPLLARGVAARAPWLATLAALALLACVGLWHLAWAGVVPTSPPTLAAGTLAAAALLLGLGLQAALRAWPDGRLARALWPWMRQGFYADRPLSWATRRRSWRRRAAAAPTRSEVGSEEAA